MKIGLPQLYKFVLLNETGTAIAIGGSVVTLRQQKFDASGVLTEGAEVTLTNASAIANTTQGDVGVEVNNSVNKYLAGYGKVTVTTTGVPSGDVSLYVVDSTANPSSYPTNLPLPIAVMNFAAAGTLSKGFEF